MHFVPWGLKLSLWARIFCRSASVAVIMGFIIGIKIAATEILANQYIHLKMFWLAGLALKHYTNHLVLKSLLWGLGLTLFALAVSTVWRLFFTTTIELKVKNRRWLLLTFDLCCMILPGYAGWNIAVKGITYSARPAFFLFNAAILLGVGCAVCFFIGKKVIPAALTLLFVMAVLNAGMTLDSRNNRPRGPNVLFIVVDTLRADHLGCYGYQRNTSPYIDALVKDSLFFANAIAAAPWTSPSIGSLITAKYPAELGLVANSEVNSLDLDDRFVTLAEIFRENSYKTYGIISHSYVSKKHGYGQGFDGYDEDNVKGHDYISSPSITEKAIAFLEQNKTSKFFLFLHYFDPHYTYMAHDAYNYSPDYVGPLHSGININELTERIRFMSFDDVEFIKALYDSEIAFTDKYIGRLIESLKDMGLYDNTLIVFTADHGEEFCEREYKYIGHGIKLHQEMIHVPLIIKLPAGGRGKKIDQSVGLIDVAPTIAEYLRLSMPTGYSFSGSSFNFTAPAAMEQRPIFSETRSMINVQSVICGDFKFIRCSAMDKRKLFNLRDDPQEAYNLAPTHDDLLREMEKTLTVWTDAFCNQKSVGVSKKTVFSEEEKARLKSLGYVK